MTPTEISSVRFGTTAIEFAVRRSARRNTVGIAVDARNGVVVTAPVGLSLSRIDSVVHGRARWIVERCRQAANADVDLPPREFVSGESYLYLGRQYRLKVVPMSQPVPTKLIGGWIHVSVRHSLTRGKRASAVRASLEAWYRGHANERLRASAEAWSQQLGVKSPRVLIRDQQKRWGSCDRHGIVRFNWRIIQAPMHLVDYVVVHELIHVVERGHTKLFWARLGRAVPEYETRREILSRMGPRFGW